MNANRKTARAVGGAFVIGTVAGILSRVVTGPIQNARDYLMGVPASETRLVVGALFVVVMGLALAMVPVLMFPILRKHNEALALGYVVFRGGLETVTYLAIATGWLSLEPISQIYAQAGAWDASNAQALGTLLLEAKEIGSVLAIVFCLGALIFNYLLYQTELVPRWLSGWGLIAIVPYLAAGLFSMFGIIDAWSPIYATLNLPLGLQEMILAVWLIVRGFNSSATVFKAAKTEPNAV
jgi:Domain of unknown function (DUF4386)